MAADEPVFTATSMIKAYGYDVELTDSVVLVFDGGLMPDRSRIHRARRGHHPFRQVARLDNNVDIVLAAGPGAPVAAITVEFLAALGVTRFVAVGSAGLLTTQAGAIEPRAMVIGRAESDEGTSGHYGGDAAASPRLTAALTAAIGGDPCVALTTDVPFRNTPARLEAHRSRADVVEMECAALFAVANHFGIAAAAILVASDEFDGNAWRPNDQEAVKPLLRSAVDISAGVMADLR